MKIQDIVNEATKPKPLGNMHANTNTYYVKELNDNGKPTIVYANTQQQAKEKFLDHCKDKSLTKADLDCRHFEQ